MYIYHSTRKVDNKQSVFMLNKAIIYKVKLIKKKKIGWHSTN